MSTDRAAVVVVVVQRATRPVRALSGPQLRKRPTPQDDLSPMQRRRGRPRELLPLVEATNTA